MKELLIKLSIWYLRKKKCSVIIGFDLSHGVTSKGNSAYLFDNDYGDSKIEVISNNIK